MEMSVDACPVLLRDWSSYRSSEHRSKAGGRQRKRLTKLYTNEPVIKISATPDETNHRRADLLRSGFLDNRRKAATRIVVQVPPALGGCV
jgi:hypothetical protein